MAGKAGMKRKRSTENTDRHHIWQAIRILRTFTAPKLCAVSGAKLDNVWTYMRRLAAHGYIIKDGNAVMGRPGSAQRYRLVRNTGPDHPVFCDKCGQSITALVCVRRCPGCKGPLDDEGQCWECNLSKKDMEKAANE